MAGSTQAHLVSLTLMIVSLTVRSDTRYHTYWAKLITNIGRDRPRSRSGHLGRLIGRMGNPNSCDKQYAQPQVVVKW
jgi:hypothetical protein